MKKINISISECFIHARNHITSLGFHFRGCIFFYTYLLHVFMCTQIAFTRVYKLLPFINQKLATASKTPKLWQEYLKEIIEIEYTSRQSRLWMVISSFALMVFFVDTIHSLNPRAISKPSFSCLANHDSQEYSSALIDNFL